MSLMLLPLLLAVAAPVVAPSPSPDDFAWQWPIVADGGDGAHTLVLDDRVYARVTRTDLRDLAVFNADGDAVPFAPLPWRHTTQEALTQLNWLRLPVAAEGSGDSLSLRIERDADGTVRDLQVDASAAAATSASTDLLIDLGEKPAPVRSLRITLGDAAARPVNLRVRVLASDDFADWRTLGEGLALVAIDDNGLRIERLRLDFTPSHERYLRLMLPDGSDWPPLARIEHEHRETGSERPDLRTISLEGSAVAGEPGVFDYVVAGPVPVTRVDLEPAAGNTVASVQVQSRTPVEANGPRATDPPPVHWKPIAAFTAFRLGNGAGEVRHLAVDTAETRDRQWRVRTTPALAQPPTLRLSYRPDRFVMLAQGAAPYRLLAGSARVARPDYPVQAALAAAGAAHPAGWLPPPAALGDGMPAAGDAALRADHGPDYRRWTLWAVLAAGALLVLVVSLRVLRAPARAHD